MSGLLSIPSAELNADKTIFVGSNYLNKKYLAYTNEEYAAFDIYTTITYLPFLELGARVTRKLNLPESTVSTHNVDRMFSFRLRIFQQNEYIPSFAVGANNPVSTEEAANHFNCLYLVTTKTIPTSSFIENISLTLGYGADVIKAADHEFVGVFGGISFKVLNSVNLVSEYDAKHFNGGVKISLFDHIQFLMCWKSYKYFNGGFGAKFGI
jgi:hypothetical protein